ncbi:MAG: MATE family efflux transporter, partial [Niameybacter sp.]
MLIGNVDQMMISRYSQTAVAAIGNVNQIMNLLIITFNIITMATTIMVAQYLGSNNNKKVSEVYSLATYTNLFFS